MNKKLFLIFTFAGFILLLGISKANSVPDSGFLQYNNRTFLSNMKGKPAWLQDISSNADYRYNGINTTENTYSTLNTITGIYNSTYTFTNITKFQKDPNWNNSYCNTGNYSIFDYTDMNTIYHHNVMNMKATTNYTDAIYMGGANKSIPQYTGNSIWNISFWYLMDSSASSLYRIFLSDSVAGLIIEFEQYTTHFHYESTQDITTNLVANVWHYIIVSFDYATSNVYFYIDNNAVVQKTFNPLCRPDMIRLCPFTVISGYCNYYIDAIDFTFDSTYSYKRNYSPIVWQFYTSNFFSQTLIESYEVVANSSKRQFNLMQLECYNYNDLESITYSYTLWGDIDMLVNITLISNNISIGYGVYSPSDYYPTPYFYTKNISINESYSKLEWNLQLSAINNTHQRIMWDFRFNENNSRVFQEYLITSAGTLYGCNTSIRSLSVGFRNFANGNTFRHNLIGVRCLENIYIFQNQITGYIYDIGYFSDNIGLVNPNPMPNPIADLPFWTYWYYSTEIDYTDTIAAGNLTLDYDIIKSVMLEGEFNYNPDVILKESMGDWNIWNFLRDAICWLVNAILVILQFIVYLFWLALAFLATGLFVAILWVFIWNTLLYWLIAGFMWLIWGLWLLLNIIYESVLIPLFNWLINDAMPVIMDVIITVIAALVALLLYCVSFGQLDITEIYTNVYEGLDSVKNYFLTSFSNLIADLAILIGAMVCYLIVLGIMYVKFIYVKARGYSNRALELYDAYTTILIPIKLVIKIGQALRAIVRSII